jgi:hypothetical protein
MASAPAPAPSQSLLRSPRDVPWVARQKFNRWRLIRTIWVILHYVLGLTSVVLAVIVGSKAVTNSRTISILSIVGGACAGAVTSLRTSAKAAVYARAVRPLEAAILAYQLDASVTEAVLSQAIREGVKLLDSEMP